MGIYGDDSRTGLNRCNFKRECRVGTSEAERISRSYAERIEISVSYVDAFPVEFVIRIAVVRTELRGSRIIVICLGPCIGKLARRIDLACDDICDDITAQVAYLTGEKERANRMFFLTIID